METPSPVPPRLMKTSAAVHPPKGAREGDSLRGAQTHDFDATLRPWVFAPEFSPARDDFCCSSLVTCHSSLAADIS